MAIYTTVFLGLGANLGDPIQQLLDARSALFGLEGNVHGRCSSFYQSTPVGYEQQADFINCVVELQTELSAIELLNAAQNIELNLGRKRVKGNQNAPRIIDIDLLLFGSQTIETKRLSIPHPRMHQRLFVLRPLLELIEMSTYRFFLENSDFSDQVVHRLRVSPVAQ